MSLSSILPCRVRFAAWSLLLMAAMSHAQAPSPVFAADTSAAPVAPAEPRPAVEAQLKCAPWHWIVGSAVVVGGGVAAIMLLGSGHESLSPTPAGTTGGADSDGSWNTTVRWK